MELKRHRRLTAIYTMLERVQQAELRLAQSAVAQVAAQEEMMGGELRAALEMQRGVGMDQAAAGTTYRYASAVLGRLQAARDEAERGRDAAEAACAESRLSLEQMKSIEAEAQRREREEEERRGQAAVDDRFGGRRWAKQKSGRR